MIPEKQVFLREKYPQIFPHEFRFMCGDGWFDIIDALCYQIQQYEQLERSQESIRVSVSTVKQKFGGLRFYTDNQDEMITGMIRVAEAISYKICENCGNSGKCNSTAGWYFTLCDKCRKEKISSLTK